MRASSGSLSSSEVDRLINASRLSELPRKPMTAKEMGLDPKLIPLLKGRGIIKHHSRRGYRSGIVWMIGNCWEEFAKKRGWC